MDINKVNKLLEKTVSFYEKTFSESDKGKEILHARRITRASLFSRHRIGFSDGSLIKALPKQGQIIDDLKALGILTKAGKEYFNGCVVFPVSDDENNLVTLTGFKDGKYIYPPTRSATLWNVSITKTYSEIYVVDTILDVLSLEQAGIDNVIVGKDVNNDRAKHYPLPDGVSASEYLIEHGEEALRALSEDKRGSEVLPVENGFILNCGQRTYTIIGLEKQGRNLKCTIRAEKAGRFHADSINLYSSKDRRQLAQDLVLAFNEIPETIQGDVNRIMKACEREQTNPSHLDGSFHSPSSLTSTEMQEAENFGKSEDLLKEILKDFELCGLVGEETNKLVCYLAMTTRKMPKPLNVMIISSSGAGKSALQDATLAFCPTSELIKLTSLSAKALFYLEENALVNKVMALEEQKGAESATYAIRTLISSDVLVTQTTIRDNTTGKLTTQENKVDAGRTSVFCTTTNPNIDAETRSRFVVTGITESRELTRAILESQRKNHTLAGLETHIIKDAVIKKHHAFQKLLKPLHVVNPFALDLKFEDDSLTARRTQPMYLQLINSVAFLHQMQKEIKIHTVAGRAIEYIEVSERDLELAEKIASTVLQTSMDDLSIPARDLLEQISCMVEQKLKNLKEADKESLLQKEDISFTRREIMNFTSWRKTRLHIHLRELIECEYVVLHARRLGGLQYYRMMSVSQSCSGGVHIGG
jgi:hypothetical protein